MEIEHTAGVYNRITTICAYLDEGLTVDEILRKMYISAPNFDELQKIYASEEYQEFLAFRRGEKEYEFFDPSGYNDNSFNMEWRKWADPLNVLKDDNNSSLYVFYFEYTSYLLNIQRYYLGTMESICKRYWTEYDPNLTIEELLNKIKRKLSYKGFNAVRKVQLLDPWIGYHQYYYDWQHRDRSTFSKMEKDIDIKSKAKWLISHNLNLASIHGEVIGIGGMLYTERKYLHETGNRSYPYLYFVQGTDVAEITVESNPRFVRGYIKEEYVEGVTKWIKDNLVVLERYWNKEIGSSELLKEVCSLDGKHCFCPKK